MIQNKWWTMTMINLTKFKWNIIPHDLPPQTHPHDPIDCCFFNLADHSLSPFWKTTKTNAETTMGWVKWTNKILNLQLTNSLPIPKNIYHWIRFRVFCAANKRKTNRHFLSVDIHNDLSQLSNKKSSLPSTCSSL